MQRVVLDSVMRDVLPEHQRKRPFRKFSIGEVSLADGTAQSDTDPIIVAPPNTPNKVAKIAVTTLPADLPTTPTVQEIPELPITATAKSEAETTPTKSTLAHVVRILGNPHVRRTLSSALDGLDLPVSNTQALISMLEDKGFESFSSRSPTKIKTATKQAPTLPESMPVTDVVTYDTTNTNPKQMMPVAPIVELDQEQAQQDKRKFGFQCGVLQSLRLFGKNNQIYGAVCADMRNGTVKSDPGLLEEGAYLFVIVTTQVENEKPKLVLRLRKAVKGGHQNMIDDKNGEKLEAAGQLNISANHQLAFADTKSGRFWEQLKGVDQHAFLSEFFNDEYFKKKDFYEYNGDDDKLDAVLLERGLRPYLEKNLVAYLAQKEARSLTQSAGSLPTENKLEPPSM